MMKSIFDTRWQVVPCADKDCWCGIVGLTEPALNPYGEEHLNYELDRYIIDYGMVSRAVAEHIVNVHNDRIDYIKNHKY
jgi:hypothetical protein